MKFKLSRKHQARRRLMNNLLVSLLTHRKIITTEAKAKALKPIAEEFISSAKTDELTLIKKAAVIFGKTGAKITNKFNKGNYNVEIFKLSERFGDGAKQSIVRIVNHENAQTKGETKK